MMMMIIIIAELICEEVADFLLVQSKFEERTLGNKIDGTHARNPFSNKQLKMATNEDVYEAQLHGLGSVQELIISIAFMSRGDIPHGSGSLKTPFGEPVYSGDWFEGTGNLII